MGFTRSYTKQCKGAGRVRVRQDLTLPTKVLALNLLWSEHSRGVDIRLMDIDDLEVCADVLRQSAVAVEEFSREVTKQVAQARVSAGGADPELEPDPGYVGLPAFCYRDVK